MDLPFLNAYLDSIGGPSFAKGCNFAAAGSTIAPTTGSVSPFSFGIQVAQFLRSKQRVLELLAKGTVSFWATFLILNCDFAVRYDKLFCYFVGKKVKKYIPSADFFNKALYMFDIGQNDLAIAFRSQSEDQVLASIPNFLSEFEAGLKVVKMFFNVKVFK